MTPSPTRQLLPRRLRRSATVIIYASLLLWFLYIAVTRWNGVPADPTLWRLPSSTPNAAIDPALDRTAELLAALAAIPQDRFSPPDGIHWPPGEPINPEEAVRGPWTPRTRPTLQAVIGLLKTTDIQEPLARLAAIRPGLCVLTMESRERVSYMQDLLCAQARYDHAEQVDIDAASEHLETLLRFAALCMTSPTGAGLTDGRNAESKAEAEISRMVFENYLTRTEAGRLIAALRSDLPDDHVLWQRYVDAAILMYLTDLDSSYMIDSSGDGWLVLSRINILNGDDASCPRLGLWNGLSPLFNSRRTVAAKIASARRGLEAVDSLSSTEAVRELARLGRQVPFNVLDGPLLSYWGSTSYLTWWRAFARHIARRRATITEIALSAYRREHREYPAFLGDLVGAYLDTVPLDPFGDQPLRYVRDPGKRDFLLYSAGFNFIDDGGRPERNGEIPTGDILFRHER